MSNEEIEMMLAVVFDALAEPAASPEREVHRADFLFHMTDWLDDLWRLHELYEHMKGRSADEAADVVHGFLVHAPSHLLFAARAVSVDVMKPEPAAVSDEFAPPR